MSGLPQVGIDKKGRLLALDVFPYRESIRDLAGARFEKAHGRYPAGWSMLATASNAGMLLTILSDSGAQISPRVAQLAHEAATREDRRALAADESAPLPDLPWHEWLTTTPWPHQMRGIGYLRGVSAAAIGAGMGPQPVDTPILTPKGWRQLGDLAPGDEVFGGGGEPVRVRDVRNFGEQPVFRVTLSDGTSTRCTAEHRWRVSTPDDRFQMRDERVLTTAQIVTQGTYRVVGSRRNRRFALPEQPVVGFPDRVLPVAPYALGALLGDGSLIEDRTPTLTCPDRDVRQRVSDEVRPLGIEAVEFDSDKRCPGVRLSKVGGRSASRLGENPLLVILRGMGLSVGGHGKFIPTEYLTASAGQRWDLLRGLLDTDGSPVGAGRGGGGVEFATVSRRLAEDVAFLARSLGIRVRTAQRTTRCQTGLFSSFRLALRVPVGARPFWCVRRVAVFTPAKNRCLRGIESIEPDGVAPVCCIELDVSDSDRAVYLADRTLIPSLNCGKTMMAIGAMNSLAVMRGLVVAPVATFGVFPRELRLHSTRKWHTENGTRRTRRGTVKKLTLPQRWNLVRELYECDCGRPHLAIVGYEAMTRDPVASADLGALGVELVLYDEVHRLKAAGGAASWTAKSWVSQVARRWGMSGTLMPQGPWDIYGTYRALDPGVFGTNQTVFRAKYIVMGKTRDGQEIPKDVFDHAKVEFSRRFHSVAYVPVVDLKLPPVTHKIESFELEPSARTVYDNIRDAGLAEISAAVLAAGGNPTPDGDERTVAPANAGVELLRFAQVTGGSVTDDGGETAVVSTAKVGALGSVLERVGCRKGGVDGRSRPEPVVVFCRFKPDLAAVANLCDKLGLRYAEISGERKDGVDDEACMNPDCDVVAAQIASGGIGIDLTRARVNVWYSVGYELWLFQQAQKRSHRKGQTRQVLHVYLIANNTVDVDIYTALARKENVVESCMWAYQRGLAECDAEDLPEMDVPGGEVAGEPVRLPDWLVAGGPPPRAVPDREREREHAAMAAMGLEDF